MILVASVAHTGTRFVRDHLLAEYPGRVIQEHVGPGRVAAWEPYLKARRVIVPLRHPLAVAESWKRRRRPVLHSIDEWERLVSMGERPYYVPLDVPDRQAWLELAAEGLALELSTDWRVVRGEEYAGDDPTLDDFERAGLVGMMRRHRGFFDLFGYGCRSTST